MTDVIAIIVNYRTARHTAECLDRLNLERQSLQGLKVIVVDGDSQDGSYEALKNHVSLKDYGRWVKLVALPLNGGFGWANNEAMRWAWQSSERPRYFHLINPDALPLERSVIALCEFLESTPRAAVAGSRILDGHGRIAQSHFDFPGLGTEFARGLNAPRLAAAFGIDRLPSAEPPKSPERCGWVSGASAMIRTSALRKCGLFDEGFFLYFEEVELMSRFADAGWEIWHVPASRVSHPGGASTGVVDGAGQARRLPAYWYQSRLRYFSLRRSSSFAKLASAAWAAGRLGSALRAAFGRGRPHLHAPRELRDMWLSHRTAPHATIPAVGRFEQERGLPPAWMRR